MVDEPRAATDVPDLAPVATAPPVTCTPPLAVGVAADVGECALAKQLAMGTRRGRLVLTTTILGSGIALLDGTIVNVALPHIGRELDADLAQLQWVVNAYALALASLILLGGSLGDRFGRARMYAIGTAGFGLASLACGLAPSIGTLIAARAVQGVAAALLVPGSLAILQASFRRKDRMAAIGAWTGLLGVASASGPIIGGWLVDHSWRWAFWLNVPLTALVVVLTVLYVPESSNPQATRRLDVAGVALAVLGLGCLTYALTTGPSHSGLLPWVIGVVGVLSLVGFVLVERRTSHPMVPPRLFESRVFTSVNIVTLLVYAGLGAALLFLVLFLQVVAGWSALAAGTATLPLSLAMLLLAQRFGALATVHGPRRYMVGGTLVAAAGFVLLGFAPSQPSYAVHILPGMTLVGLGLAMLVAPLTGTVLAAAPDELSGTASGVNNAVSRTAGLLAVAALPPLVGLSGAAYEDPVAMASAYRAAMWVCAGLVASGAVITALGLRAEPVGQAQPEVA
ncbi:major facilitator transporter [Intrasporangium oryzae NRRL B-24470]|uniref:Major facilitator transporter n=1 Tax=Intrasporangium oryzae NRRL B-24470 TaxID=1386089 RepID=W9GA00_9MICO|nr:MFS transporter [Intrasporangium oryzae]EWT02047.1 major facilitator transporter [Intrasporangium oryzae NRRL B-24470]